MPPPLVPAVAEEDDDGPPTVRLPRINAVGIEGTTTRRAVTEWTRAAQEP